MDVILMGVRRRPTPGAEENNPVSDHTARSDVHAPKSLVTEDYIYLASHDLNPREDDGFERHSLEQNKVINAAFDQLEAQGKSAGTCGHCGHTPLRYIAILLHRPTAEYIVVGEQCLDNRFGRATADFQALRKQAQLDREAQRIKGLVAEFVAANPDLAFLADKAHVHTNSFVADVSRKLRQYGSLSERQIEAVRSSAARDAQWAKERAEKAAAQTALEADQPHSDVPEGRQVVTGVVLSLKEVEDQFAPVSRWSNYTPTIWKQLVLDDRGFKVYGTVPSALDPEKGSRVQFTATLTRSQKDGGFGFYSRPTKASILSQEAAA
jgi:hypothetical protein